jgi:hypothetical protein
MMLRHLSQSLFALSLLATLGSCAKKPVAQIEDARHYNIQFVAVTGDPDVSPNVVGQVQQAISESAATTLRRRESTDADLNVRLSGIDSVLGPQGPAYVMNINAALTDIRDGRLISVGEFQVAAAPQAGADVTQVLQQNAVAQIRYAYGLAPPLPKPVIIRDKVKIARNQPKMKAPELLEERDVGRAEMVPEPMTPEQMTEQALNNPDPVLNQNSVIDLSKDPLLVPGMKPVPSDPAVLQGNQTPDMPRMETSLPPPVNDLTKLNSESAALPETNEPAAPAEAIIPKKRPAETGIMDKKSTDKPEKATPKPVVATGEPAKEPDLALRPAKAFSNLENGAAANIAIPDKMEKPVTPPATVAADAQSIPLPKVMPEEPCVVTVTNDCKLPPAAK